MLSYLLARAAQRAVLPFFSRILRSLLVASVCVACENSADAPSMSPDPAEPSAPVDGEAAPGTAQDAAQMSGPKPQEMDAGREPDAQSPQRDAAAMDAASANDSAPSALAASLDADAAPSTAEHTSDFAVGTLRVEIGADGGRTLPVQIWYPARESARAEAEQGHSIEDFEKDARRELLTGLIKDARKGCPNLTMHAALDAEPYAQSTLFPLVVYSHHFSGSRFSMFSVAESLAQKGIVVAAPDHVNGSLFERTDELTDSLNQLNDAFLQTRANDLKRVVDVMLDAQAGVIPQGIRGRIDATRVGAAGHSLGGITVGVFSVNDPRVKASAYLAIAPYFELGTLLLTVPKPETFRTPGLYVMASEDAVVASSGGKEQLVANFTGQAPAAWLVELHDAGHFSFADDCALVPEFDACCGTGERVADGMEFTYVEPKLARDVAGRYSALFFAAQLQGADPADLAEAVPSGSVVVQQHPATRPSP
jgi:predicted dienelactone hydrolase